MAQVTTDDQTAVDDLAFLFDDDNYDINPDVVQGLAANAAADKSSAPARGGADLGLDEVKVTKQRAPIAKLDEARLLSQAGIPKLQRITKQRLKFKGKGHEFSDITRLLNTYQLWLDDLYPRAKFADGIAIIEKLGHTKKMQTMRKAWIDEGKPKPSVDEIEVPEPDQPIISEDRTPRQEGEGNDEPNPLEEDLGDSLFVPDHRQPAGHSGSTDEPMQDELDALLAEDTTREKQAPQATLSQPNITSSHTQHPDDDQDELDALMAEDEARGRPTAGSSADCPPDAPFDDDFADAEAAMRDLW